MPAARQAPDVRAVGADDVEIVPGACIGCVGDPEPVGRPFWRTLVAFVVNKFPEARPIGADDARGHYSGRCASG